MEVDTQRGVNFAVVNRYLVTTFSIVPRGTEGAVSLEGTFAGLVASVILAAVAWSMNLVSFPYAPGAISANFVVGHSFLFLRSLEALPEIGTAQGSTVSAVCFVGGNRIQSSQDDGWFKKLFFLSKQSELFNSYGSIMCLRYSGNTMDPKFHLVYDSSDLI